MRIDRRVVRRKDQYLVAIPAQVRHQLGLVAGARVWWHTGQKAMVALTTSGRIQKGRIRLDADCTSCVGYRRELAQLRAKLQAQPQRIRNEVWMQHALKRLSVELRGYPALDAINRRLGDIEAHLAGLPFPRRRRAARAPRPKPARQVEVVDAPVLVLPDGAPAVEEPRPDSSPW